MSVILQDENQLYHLLNPKVEPSTHNYFLKNFLENIIDNYTLEAVKTYNIELLSIFNIGSKPMLYFKKKKKRRYTNNYLVKQALKGKPISYFKVSEDGEPYFIGPETIILRLGDTITDKKFLRLKRKLLKREGKNFTLDLASINRYAGNINNGFMLSAINAGKKDYAFISRYNAENFNTHIYINEHRLTLQNVNCIYEGRRDFIDLENLDLRSAFIAIYGIVKDYFTFEDVFSVDRIFSFSINRNLDNKKRLAASEVFMLFLDSKADLENCFSLFQNLSEHLMLPFLDISNISLIKKNYSYYKALSSMGEVLFSLASYYPSLNETAKKIHYFSFYIEYYELIEKKSDFSDEIDLVFDKIREFEKMINNA